MRQELRETAICNTVIEAIALGNTAFNEILTKTGIEKSKLSVYLKNHIELGIVERKFTPHSSAKERSSRHAMNKSTCHMEYVPEKPF